MLQVENRCSFPRLACFYKSTENHSKWGAKNKTIINWTSFDPNIKFNREIVQNNHENILTNTTFVIEIVMETFIKTVKQQHSETHVKQYTAILFHVFQLPWNNRSNCPKLNDSWTWCWNRYSLRAGYFLLIFTILAGIVVNDISFSGEQMKVKLAVICYPVVYASIFCHFLFFRLQS